jgi:secondary thiamine-phosphate synthase enzyme
MISISVASKRAIHALDVTDVILEQQWPNGFLWISCPHTTAALLLGENDPDMLADYERIARELFAPFEPFRHSRNGKPNAAAHLLSSIAGTQIVLPVIDGRPALGTFQRVIFLELDGPKPSRTIQVASIPVSWPVGAAETR